MWQDVNANATQDAGETGIPGVRICAAPVAYASARCAASNPMGIYRICLPSGTYLLAPAAVPAGLTPTTQPFKLPIPVKPGQSRAGFNFGFK